MEQDKKQHSAMIVWQSIKNRLAIVLSVILILAMLMVVSDPLGLFTRHDVSYEFLAACIGAIVTSIIAALLLNSQTKQQKKLQEEATRQELDQIKKTKQYEEKLRIYQDYLLALSKVIEDRDLSEKEKITMQFRTAILAMHTDPEHVVGISNHFKEVFECLCKDRKDGKEYDAKKLQEHLFDIVQIYRDELYPDCSDQNSPREYQEACKIFGDAFDGMDNGEIVKKQQNRPGVPDDDWEVSKSRWKEKQWELEEDIDWIRLYRKDANGNARVGEIHFGFDEGHYYILAKYGNNTDFAKALKWDNGGRRSYGTWWVYLDEKPICDMKEGEFGLVSEQSENVRKILVSWFDYLMDEIEKQDKKTLE